MMFRSLRALTALSVAILSASSSIGADEPKGLTILGKSEVEQEALPEIEPIAPEIPQNWLRTAFTGEFTVMLWEAKQAKLEIKTPYPYDQFVQVLKGELIMTDAEGKSATFRKGDRFVLQKGFTGTWHMTEDYREMAIISPQQMNAGDQQAAEAESDEAGE